jgi:hypothetical protein
MHIKRLSKIVYYLSIAFIVCCFSLLILIKIADLEFSQSSYEQFYENALFIGVPVAIFLTIFRVGFKNIPNKKIGLAITKSIIIALSYFGVYILYGIASFASDMCSWSNDDTLLVNKAYKSTMIVVRDFGCGAVDSSPPTYDTFKMKEVTPFLLHFSRVKVNELDSKEWISANANLPIQQ